MAIPPGVLNSPKMVARREASAQRMRKIAEAMQAYSAEHGHLPAWCSTDEQGRPLLSWRVHLLPALGYAELYEKFHLDEPWDSEHNRALLSQMPQEYAGPSTGDQPSGGELSAMYVVRRADESDARNNDGEAPGVVLIEARRDVPWTQPSDFEIDENGRLVEAPRGWQPGGMMVCRADGTVAFVISADVAQTVFNGSTSKPASE